MSAPAIRSVLVALDESQVAPLVFDTAAAIARTLKAQLSLVRVLTLPPEIPPAAHTPPDHLLEKLQREALSQLQVFVASAPDVTFGSTRVVPGDPWRQIIEVAADLDVDLIVVGSHRYHGIDRVLGTVAAKVVNHAGRNVLVVHQRGPRRLSTQGS